MTTSPPLPQTRASGIDLSARLQLALDLVSIGNATLLVTRLAGRFSRLEVGTPLILAAGFGAIAQLRSAAVGPVVVVADVKICDAGERIAQTAFASGADAVTVVAAAVDDTTWLGVLRAAHEYSNTSNGVAPVMLDTIGREFDPHLLERLGRMAVDAGVAVDLCMHRPKTGSASFADLRTMLGTYAAGFETLAIAGRVTASDLVAARDAGFGILVIGSAIADAADPVAAWDEFRAAER